MKKLTQHIAIWTIIIAALTLFCGYYFREFAPTAYFPTFPVIPILFFFMGYALCFLSEKMANMSAVRFNNWFLGFTLIKLMISCVFILIYIKANIRPALIIYIIYFFTLLIFEITVFIRTIKKKKS